jgi:hypothetical protein
MVQQLEVAHFDAIGSFCEGLSARLIDRVQEETRATVLGHGDYTMSRGSSPGVA